jgi:putative membrane protein
MLWLKALHIIFVICWFAGIFYLPRLLVNYAACEHDESRQLLAQMSRKLYRFITPFMVIAIGFGIALATTNLNYFLHAKWMWLKLAGVVCLVIYHILCGRYVYQINNQQNTHSPRFFRFFNEIPVFFLFAIVLLVVLKPF